MNILNNQKGFSLIETIMVIIVISIGAIGVLSVFITGMKGAGSPLVTIQAVELAQGELDQIIGEKQLTNGFASLATGSCITTMLTGFTCSRDVYYVDPTGLNTQVAGPTNYKHVTVTITNSAIGSVTAVTLVANY